MINYTGRYYQSSEWPDCIHYARVLTVSGGAVYVAVHAEAGEFREMWNLWHFRDGLASGLYRELEL